MAYNPGKVTALLFVLGFIVLLFLVMLTLILLWRRTPEGPLCWKLAVILKIYRKREQRRKAEIENITVYRERSDANMLRFIDSYSGAAESEDRFIPGPAGTVPVRIFRPIVREKDTENGRGGKRPLILFFHGGGFVAGSVETHDPICRRLAAETGCIVLSADYRLAPEHPFPAAPEDCYAVLEWSAEHAGDFGADPDMLITAGDSAGGTLAAVTAMRSRDRGGPGIGYQVLIYPSTNGRFMGMPSHFTFKEGYFLETRQMKWFCDRYVPDPAERSHPYASPLKADTFHGLPPTLLLTARFDPLRDEGKAYAEKLREAGVPVTYRCFPGVTHGFLGMPKICTAAEEAFGLIGSTLRRWNDGRGLQRTALKADAP